MDFKILISTTDDFFLKRDYRPSCDYLVINQIINIERGALCTPNCISLVEKGVSKSRNAALSFCESGLALISDDDVSYVKDVEHVIKKAFDENPEADIITFQFLDNDYRLYKRNYRQKTFWHDVYSLAKVSSVEIAFRVDSIKGANLRFDENFGLGSKLPSGEEYIFLVDALKRGLKILYMPIPILIHPGESSGGQFKSNPDLIMSKGAMLYRIFGYKSYLMALVFALRKYKRAHMSFVNFYRLMISGIKLYRKDGVTSER
ncbi:hypothetical protein [Salinivibrio kushneri]|uniref:hypothetical protein n=1 Tax=Salinivibrio kushneri TaxID=1908198 RepID=UPI000986A731|nr:hypothetical protein [Salinivibrio kushneri]OOE62351.1 hypothetical protein BZG18_05255 [Salinivibrio kushneri]